MAEREKSRVYIADHSQALESTLLVGNVGFAEHVWQSIDPLYGPFVKETDSSDDMKMTVGTIKSMGINSTNSARFYD